jgi:hypothetical protein
MVALLDPSDQNIPGGSVRVSVKNATFEPAVKRIGVIGTYCRIRYVVIVGEVKVGPAGAESVKVIDTGPLYTTNGIGNPIKELDVLVISEVANVTGCVVHVVMSPKVEESSLC